MSKLNEIKFDFIRYANCWEDADILSVALNIQPGDKVLSIASAGDNSFSLLLHNPSLIVGVDVNPVQLWLTELKMVAIKHLSREEYLAFAGFTPDTNRLSTYENFKNELSEEALQYWNTHRSLIEEGIVYQGKFEKYFRFFAKKLLPFIHTNKRINKLFEDKSESQQVTFYNKKWNNLRWRFFFSVFFSKYVLGKFGRDPKFMTHVKTTVSKYIYAKSAHHLSSKACQQNFMLQFILKGKFDALPHYVRAENYDIIRQRINRIKLEKGLAQEVALKYDGFNAFNLSNIFEYMDENVFCEVTRELIRHAKPGARFAYWNLMVPRKISEVQPELVKPDEALSNTLTAADKGFFYGGFFIDKVKS